MCTSISYIAMNVHSTNGPHRSPEMYTEFRNYIKIEVSYVPMIYFRNISIDSHSFSRLFFCLGYKTWKNFLPTARTSLNCTRYK